MKKFIYITYLMLGIFSFSVNAQMNNLSQSEYLNVKFDGVRVADISNTKGNVDEMQNLFNNNLTIERGYSDAIEHWIKFSTNSICVEFYNGVEENSVITYSLASIEIENTQSNLLIKGRTIKIGDNQSLLSNLNSRIINNKKVFTFLMGNLDEYSYIYVDTATGKVVKIGYDGNLL